MSLSKKEIRGLIYECKSHQVLNEHWELLTEVQRRDIKQFERELVPLFENLKLALEANLTEPQVQDLFKKAEQVAAGGDNRTLIGKGADVAGSIAKLPLQAYKAINDKLDQLFKDKIKTTQPVKDFDAAFNKFKTQLIEKTGGKDAFVSQSIQKYQKLAKEHPVAQSLILGVMAALVTFAVANPIGLGIGAGAAGSAIVGAVVNFAIKSVDRLLKGQEISDVIFQGVKSAALGALIGLGVRGIAKFVEGVHVQLTDKIPLERGNITMSTGSIQWQVEDENTIEALKKLGVDPSGSKIMDFMAPGDANEKIVNAIDAAKTHMQVALDSNDPTAIANAVKEIDAVEKLCEQASNQWHKLFEKTNDYVLNPENNQLLQEKGIKKILTWDEYDKFYEGLSHEAKVAAEKASTSALVNAGVANDSGSLFCNFDTPPRGFVPTPDFAKKCAEVYNAAKTTAISVSTDVSYETASSNGYAVTSLIKTITSGGDLQAPSVVGQIFNLQKIGKIYNALGQALQTATQQGASTAIDHKQDQQGQQPPAPAQPAPPAPVNESLEHKYLYMYNEGLWDTIKQKTSQAVGAVKNVAHNVTNKVTADKLNQAWVKVGKPLDLNAVMNVIKQGGLNDDQLHQLQNSPDQAQAPTTPVDNNLKQLVDSIKKQNLVDAVKSYLSTPPQPAV